jgi:hypothetical protein
MFTDKSAVPCQTRPLIQIKRGSCFPVIFSARRPVQERTVARATNLSQSPTDDLALADLTDRKQIIANEILHHRRLVQRFGKRGAH